MKKMIQPSGGLNLDIDHLLGLSTEQLTETYNELLKRLPSQAPIYLPTERIPLIDRVIGVDHVARIYKHDLDSIYRPKLRALREKYLNKRRCFLIGNGPSLNQTDLKALADETTFAVNGFFLKSKDLNWQPTFYIVEDHLVAEDRAHWINQIKGPTKLFPAYLGYMFPQADDTIFYNHRPRKSYPHGFDFSLEADKITYTGCTVTFSMMQLAAYMGFEEIYLIGVDASYDIPPDVLEGKDYSVGVLDMKSDDTNHFDPNYFGKGYRWHDPQVHKMVEAYAEARRVLEGTSQRIYNAGIGGKLEVFERRAFASVLPQARPPEAVEQDNADRKNAKWPRLLIFDMTPMGNGTATGEIKATLFDSWPAERILQVARHGKEGLQTVTVTGDREFALKTVDEANAVAAIDAFAPDIILYRPVPDTPVLHNLAMATIDRLDRPVSIWLMDDWLSDLAERDEAQGIAMGKDLSNLLKRSALNLSISEKMSKAFDTRFGVPFQHFANAVDPVSWPAPRHHEGNALRVRYSGGLAKNMTLESVLRVSAAVEALAHQGLDISFEISTQPWWMRDFGHMFASFRHTKIESTSRNTEEYRQWLADADVLVIAYNFDETSLRYVQYSMANKMPECLASGAVLLAHGPRDVATIEYLESSNCTQVVLEPSAAAVGQALRELSASPKLRNRLARTAREFAFRYHNVHDVRTSLHAALASAAKTSPARAPITMPGLLDGSTIGASTGINVRTGLRLASCHLLLGKKAPNQVNLAPYRDAVEVGLKELAADDPLREHFLSVVAWVRNGNGNPEMLEALGLTAHSEN